MVCPIRPFSWKVGIDFWTKWEQDALLRVYPASFKRRCDHGRKEQKVFENCPKVGLWIVRCRRSCDLKRQRGWTVLCIFAARKAQPLGLKCVIRYCVDEGAASFAKCICLGNSKCLCRLIPKSHSSSFSAGLSKMLYGLAWEMRIFSWKNRQGKHNFARRVPWMKRGLHIVFDISSI